MAASMVAQWGYMLGVPKVASKAPKKVGPMEADWADYSVPMTVAQMAVSLVAHWETMTVVTKAETRAAQRVSKWVVPMEKQKADS